MMTKIKMPNQPLTRDNHGRVRFIENPIVEYMLEAGSWKYRYEQTG